MITYEEFNTGVKKYFSFLGEKYGFLELQKGKSNTLIYEIEYTNETLIISISYEIMGDVINIIIFKNINGRQSNYNDYENTIHLNQIMKSSRRDEIINQLVLCKSEFNHLEKPESFLEDELLNKAKILLSQFNTSILDHLINNLVY